MDKSRFSVLNVFYVLFFFKQGLKRKKISADNFNKIGKETYVNIFESNINNSLFILGMYVEKYNYRVSFGLVLEHYFIL